MLKILSWKLDLIMQLDSFLLNKDSDCLGGISNKLSCCFIMAPEITTVVHKQITVKTQ